MSKEVQLPATVKNLSKKQVKKAVFEKLSTALAGYENSFKKKKFESKLKQASKLFAVDIAKNFKKKNNPVISKKEAKQ